MNWDDWGQNIEQIITEMDAWVMTHVDNINLYFYWAFTIAIGVWGIAKLISRLSLRGSLDRSAVGRTLRSQKTAESIALISTAIFWGSVVADYYGVFDSPISISFLLVMVMVIGSAIAAILNVGFAVVLNREDDTYLIGDDDV
jgi:hypothetical protein